MVSRFSKWRTYPLQNYILNGEFHITHSNQQPQVTFHEYDHLTDTLNIQSLLANTQLIPYLREHYLSTPILARRAFAGMIKRAARVDTKIRVTTFTKHHKPVLCIYHLSDPKGRFEKTFCLDEPVSIPEELVEKLKVTKVTIDITYQPKSIGTKQTIKEDLTALFKMSGISMNNAISEIARLLKKHRTRRKSK